MLLKFVQRHLLDFVRNNSLNLPGIYEIFVEIGRVYFESVNDIHICLFYII